jgi:hypothetical protein
MHVSERSGDGEHGVGLAGLARRTCEESSAQDVAGLDVPVHDGRQALVGCM